MSQAASPQTLLTHLLNELIDERTKTINGYDPDADLTLSAIEQFIEFAHAWLKANQPTGMTFVAAGLALRMQDASEYPLLPAISQGRSAADSPGVSLASNHIAKPGVIRHGDVPITRGT